MSNNQNEAIREVNDKVAKFVVHGPFEVPTKRTAKGKGLAIEQLDTAFWKRKGWEALAKKCGCYVFAIKASKGYMPWYVGRTTKQSFDKECFTDHKLVLYMDVMMDCRRGIPMIFFLVPPTKQGPLNRTLIGQVESFFIRAGLNRNSNLRNKQGTKLPRWGVSGVKRGGKGPPSSNAAEFRKLFGFNGRMTS